MTNSTIHGWKKSTFAAFGNIVGLFCLGIMSVAGLGTILKASEMIFNVVKYAGAVYLIYLGLKLIFQDKGEPATGAGSFISRNISAGQIFFQAFGVAISNPKAVIFLTALFPQFIDTNKALIPQFSMLIATLMMFSFSFLMIYALLARKIKAVLTRPSRVRVFNRVGGSIFIGFGLLLAASSNK